MVILLKANKTERKQNKKQKNQVSSVRKTFCVCVYVNVVKLAKYIYTK